MLRSQLSHLRRRSNSFNWLSPESHRPASKSRTTSFRTNDRTINAAKKDLKKTDVKRDVKTEIKTDVAPPVAVEVETKTSTFTDPEKSTDSEPAALVEKERVVRVLNFDELPQWMQIDPYIRMGYRRPSNSFKACFLSLFYPHNEFVSTWSHLLPGLFFLGLLVLGDYPLLHNISDVSRADNLAVQMYVCGTIGCLFLSVCIYLETPILFSNDSLNFPGILSRGQRTLTQRCTPLFKARLPRHHAYHLHYMHVSDLLWLVRPIQTADPVHCHHAPLRWGRILGSP